MPNFGEYIRQVAYLRVYQGFGLVQEYANCYYLRVEDEEGYGDLNVAISFDLEPSFELGQPDLEEVQLSWIQWAIGAIEYDG